MKKAATFCASLLLAYCLLVPASQAKAPIQINWNLLQSLQSQAPKLNPQALKLALQVAACAQSGGEANVDRISVIDYSAPSDAKRLWIFDLRDARLLFNEWVAHGVNSGANLAKHFSNNPQSRQTSIGVYKTAETYSGKHGLSLRLDGLDDGWNSRARERAIVVHGADYVDPQKVGAWGRIGRSWGCPAVRRAVSAELIDTIKGGQLLVAWYPERSWIDSVALAQCPAARIERKPARTPLIVAQSASPKPRLQLVPPGDERQLVAEEPQGPASLALNEAERAQDEGSL